MNSQFTLVFFSFPLKFECIFSLVQGNSYLTLLTKLLKSLREINGILYSFLFKNLSEDKCCTVNFLPLCQNNSKLTLRVGKKSDGINISLKIFLSAWFKMYESV